MRKTLTGGAVLALLAAFVFSPIAFGEDEDQPTIIIENMRHDFGEVFEQDSYRHAFKVKNEGKAELRIDKVKPG
jgi:hypothetical protein